jgi:hypothetical protein
MSGDRPDDGFLSRWSRRKAEARVQPPPEAEAPPPPTVDAPPAPEAEMTAEEIATLPPIETADAEALKAYLRRGVPAALKTLAMRRMWAANPVIRDHVDPALDYAFDWNTPGLAPWSPLGAGDDARAVAERILKGPAPQADATAPGAAPDGGDPVPEAREDDAEAVSGPPSAPPSAPPATLAADSGAGAEVRTAQAHGSQPESPPAPFAGRPARRRHGGAAPS